MIGPDGTQHSSYEANIQEKKSWAVHQITNIRSSDPDSERSSLLGRLLGSTEHVLYELCFVIVKVWQCTNLPVFPRLLLGLQQPRLQDWFGRFQFPPSLARSGPSAAGSERGTDVPASLLCASGLDWLFADGRLGCVFRCLVWVKVCASERLLVYILEHPQTVLAETISPLGTMCDWSVSTTLSVWLEAWWTYVTFWWKGEWE